MGLAMANNLQRHLATKNALSLLYNNRTMARGDALQALGGTPASSFEQLVGKCGIIFTMVCPPIIGEYRYIHSSRYLHPRMSHNFI